jgi:3-phenylpropionate/trans-cinnamate dioxygenase ferredoxin subunit
MDGYIFAIHDNELPSGMMKTVRLGHKTIAFARVDDSVFAIDDTCSHEECSLGSEGALDGNVVICGCHGGQFDVKTGKVLALPAVHDVKSYQVKVENGDIFVKV